MSHAARSHSRYSPSSAHRWTACPGSVALAETVPPRPPSPYAEEGTRAHEALERLLTGKPHGSDDAEMLEAITVAANYVNSLEGERHFETQVPLPFGEKQSGTADAIVVQPDHVHLIDYKHGSGVPVAAVENKQLLCYALGALNAGYVAEKVSMTIIQPRAGEWPVRTWTLPLDELLLRLPEFQEAIEAAEYVQQRQVDALPEESIADHLNPGETQCRWCPAAEAGICPALHSRALTVAQAEFKGVTRLDELRAVHLPAPQELTVDKMAEVMSAANLLEQWFKDVRSCALDLAKNGKEVPGYKLVQPNPRRKWDGEPGVLAKRLAKLTGTEPTEWMRSDLVTITDAEKRLRAWAKEHEQDPKALIESVADMTLRASSGALSLAPVSDPRPAVNPGSDFEAVNTAALDDGDSAEKG